jgi:hypothetical protein
MAANFPRRLAPVLPSIPVLKILQVWRRQPIKPCIVPKRKAETGYAWPEFELMAAKEAAGMRRIGLIEQWATNLSWDR